LLSGRSEAARRKLLSPAKHLFALRSLASLGRRERTRTCPSSYPVIRATKQPMPRSLPFCGRPLWQSTNETTR